MNIRKRCSDRSGRAPLPSPGRPSVAGRDERRRFWAAIAAGMASEEAAVEAGVSQAVGTRWFREAGKGASVSLFRLLCRQTSSCVEQSTDVPRATASALAETGGAVGQRLPIDLARSRRRSPLSGPRCQRASR